MNMRIPVGTLRMYLRGVFIFVNLRSLIIRVQVRLVIDDSVRMSLKLLLLVVVHGNFYNAYLSNGQFFSLRNCGLHHKNEKEYVDRLWFT